MATAPPPARPSPPRAAAAAALGPGTGPGVAASGARSHGHGAAAPPAPPRPPRAPRRPLGPPGGPHRSPAALPGLRLRGVPGAVPGVWLRRLAALQPHRLRLPRLRLHQSHRELQQGGRHHVADLLGGVRRLQRSRVLLRHLPLLVPLLLRWEVPVPGVVHGPRVLERLAGAVPQRHPALLPQAPPGRGLRARRPQHQGAGRGLHRHPRSLQGSREAGAGREERLRHWDDTGTILVPPPAMTSKAKRVLPTRPEPPTVEQVLADVGGTRPADPILLLPAEPPRTPGGDHDSPVPGQEAAEEEERERLYRQSRGYVEMNRWLREARGQLAEKCQELRRAGAALERDMAETRQKAF
uniref:CS025 protein n=1 Tax=Anas zonorhyncha TaxID=75864 RepID=A0A8B9TZT5_9AVES